MNPAPARLHAAAGDKCLICVMVGCDGGVLNVSAISASFVSAGGNAIQVQALQGRRWPERRSRLSAWRCPNPGLAQGTRSAELNPACRLFRTNVVGRAAS